MDLFLIFFNIFCGIYSIPKESNDMAVVQSIKSECVPFLFLSSRFMTYAPSSILRKLPLEKIPLNSGCN